MSKRVTREAKLRWIPISDMKSSPHAQRDINNNRVRYLAENFDPEQVGTPTVSLRDGTYWVIDGQHRIEAMRAMGWDDQSMQCWCYDDLTEEEEAEKFLQLNDTLTVSAFDKFTKGVTARRVAETEINQVVKKQRLLISKTRQPGSIFAVGTLRKIYERAGSDVLSRTLGIIRDAYGDVGLEASVMDGISLVCSRYGTSFTDEMMIKKLAGTHAGVNGLLGKAEVLRQRTANSKGQCVAAAAVDIYNTGKGGRKLPDWWKVAV